MASSVSEMTKIYFSLENLLTDVYSTPPNLASMQKKIDSLTFKEKSSATTLYKYNINVLAKSICLLDKNPLLCISADSLWPPCISLVLSLTDKEENIEKKVKMYVFWQFLNNLIHYFQDPFLENLEGSIETHLAIDVEEQKKIFTSEILPLLNHADRDLFCNCLFFETIEAFFNPEKLSLKNLLLKKVKDASAISLEAPGHNKKLKIKAISNPLKFKLKLPASTITSIKKDSVYLIYPSLKKIISLHDIQNIEESDLKYIVKHFSEATAESPSFFLSMIIYIIESIYYDCDIEPFELLDDFKPINILYEYDYFESILLPRLQAIKTKSLEKSVSIICEIIYSSSVKHALMEIK